MDNNFLVRLFGFRASFVHGDAMMLDRWRWLKRRLPATRNGETLLDVGCGTGAFSLGAASRGYASVGLSWDERNQRVARDRAEICKLHSVEFPIQDLRDLDQRKDLHSSFDFIICFENIEHIMDDRKLMRSMVTCLRPGGRLLLTAPSYFYRAISKEYLGPFSRIEDGWHVRRGYSSGMLEELCDDSGLMIEEISGCSGFFSQKVTVLNHAVVGRLGKLGWPLSLPFRLLPILFDGVIRKVLRYPDFSICLMAYKPRYLTTEEVRLRGPRHAQMAA